MADKTRDIRKLEDANGCIAEMCDELKALLLEKNRKYNNSIFNPKRMFCGSTVGELIRVRIDDKLSRILGGNLDNSEDTQWDLIGYLLLLRIYEKFRIPTPLPEKPIKKDGIMYQESDEDWYDPRDL